MFGDLIHGSAGDAAERLPSALWCLPILLVFLMVLEAVYPSRIALGPIARRWAIHAVLYSINASIAAALAPHRWAVGWGAFAFAERALGPLIASIIGLLLLDFAFFALHRLQHVSTSLWQLHMVHHSDHDVDVSTAVRHHPAEYLINCCYLGALTVLLDLPPSVIALYGAIAVAVQMTQHANFVWPPQAERLARFVFITPGLHLRHHSSDERYHNVNFGIVFSFWDHLFGSIEATGTVEDFGVKNIDKTKCATLSGIFLLPLAERPRDTSVSAD